jgi:LCP family protein required for cell wall assembly
MLSSVKNFFLTFVLSFVIFGLIASAAVGIIVNNINGTIAVDTGSETAALVTDPSGSSYTPPDEDDGSASLNILLIGTDFRPSVIAGYDPDKAGIFEPESGEEDDYEPPAPPPDLAKPASTVSIISDSVFLEADGIKIDDDTLVFRNGFYKVEYRVIETDALLLVCLDRERGRITYSALPVDAYTVVDGKNVKLSEIYDRFGLDVLRDRIHAITGIAVDRYAVISAEQFPDLIDLLGGVNYYVPCNMSYDDYSGDVHINLKAGRQTLDGKMALQLLMYNGYTDGINSRARTTVTFFQTLVNTLAQARNLTKLRDIWEMIGTMYRTDVTSEDFTRSLPLIFRIAGNQTEVSAVTTYRTVNSEKYLFIDEGATASEFAGCKRLFGKAD